MYTLIIKQSDGTEKSVSLVKATLEEVAQWVNQAPDLGDRQKRKQIAFHRLYGNPQSFSKAFKFK